MMEQKRALIFPFAVDKDNLMENPLKIPITCLTSECGKLERQVSWTSIAGCKLRQNDSQHKNGSVLFDHSHAAIARRKPRLILKDVLKTEQGKMYMERKQQSHPSENRRQETSARREIGPCREQPLICREIRSNHREAINDKNKSITPKHNRKTNPSPSPTQTFNQSIRFSRRRQNVDDNKDAEELTIGKDNKFTEVVDCGLSVSWEAAQDSKGCEETSPASVKDMGTDADNVEQRSLKRRMKDSGSQCNGAISPKRHRKSVLHLTGEDGKDGGVVPAVACLEEGEEGDLENLDRSILQFTVGGEDRTEILVPVMNPNLEAADVIVSPTRRLSSPDNTTKMIPFEPIVLSSDDEENGDIPQQCSSLVHTIVTMDGTVMQGEISQDAVDKQQEASDIQDMEVLHVAVDDLSDLLVPSPTPTIDSSCMGIGFSTLHCGAYKGKSNGVLMMAEHKIIIPLKDTCERVEVTLTLERKELRRYSVWDQEEMEVQNLQLVGEEEPYPAAVLLFCVSETAADAIQRDLRKLCVKQDPTSNTGMASPFVLLTLKNPLEGMEGALLRSLLDIDCLNSLSLEQSTVEHGNLFSGWEDILTPVLSLDESIELIKRTGLNFNLLSLLGLETSDTGLDTTQDERDQSTTAHISAEAELHKETVQELEEAPDQDTETQLSPDEDQREQEIEHPSENKPNLYTLCHRRTTGSYSVSLCKPSSNWTKYKHQGLARRLIQFPPPPLKGGITVTMEDLQCLDSGQFLNDVIIDFYLKYLLQKASAAVAERSHIFSSFFYKQLTRRDNASEGTTTDSCQRQRRHQRVKTWTRHVDIFEKDFLFVPVNQEAHWYLVVICFPGLHDPKVEPWTRPDSQAVKCHGGTGELQDQDEAKGSKSPNGNAETRPTLNPGDRSDTEKENAQEEVKKDPPPGPVNCTEQTCQNTAVCKRPCILIMDSLKLSLHERVFKLLREYLQSEWEARRGSSRDFGPDQMKSSHCQVPLQDNSSDCGLYLLQYVESFLKDPVVHFDLPLHLKRWFPRQQVRRKRDEIRDLILNLYRHQNHSRGYNRDNR